MKTQWGKLQNPQGFGDVPTKEGSYLMWMQLDGMKIQGPYFRKYIVSGDLQLLWTKSSEKYRKLMIFSLNKIIFLKMCFLHCMHSPQIVYVHVFNSTLGYVPPFCFFFTLSIRCIDTAVFAGTLLSVWQPQTGSQLWNPTSNFLWNIIRGISFLKKIKLHMCKNLNTSTFLL